MLHTPPRDAPDSSTEEAMDEDALKARFAERSQPAAAPPAAAAQLATQAAVIAQVLQQMGITGAAPQGSRLGPRTMNAKDLAPNDVKHFGGVWLEFANWWTMLRNDRKPAM